MHHVQHHLAAFIDKPFDETSTLYAGINHLTFIYDFRWKGADAWPLVRAKVDRELAEPRRPRRHRQHLRRRHEGVEQPVLVGDLPSLRCLPRCRGPACHRVLPRAVGGRQVLRQDARRRRVLGPGDPGVGREPLPVDGRAGRRHGAARRDRSSTARAASRSSSSPSSARCSPTRARCSRATSSTAAAVPGLPDDAALEIPGVATARGIRPVAGARPVRSPRRRSSRGDCSSVYLAMEAAMTGDRDLVVEAMIADGAVTDPDAAAA